MLREGVVTGVEPEISGACGTVETLRKERQVKKAALREVAAEAAEGRRIPPHDPAFATRTSRYGYGVDVRATYLHLPCQPFWTWLTGKWPTAPEPRRAIETLLTPARMGLQLAWSWGVVAAALTVGYLTFHAETLALPAKVAVTLVVWLLVTNRTRGLLHTFHYTNHGASLRSERLARFLAKYFMSVPIMHLPWENYHRIHARDHHGTKSLCTGADPDEVFMREHGFYPGMPEREFWTKLVLAPVHPRAVYNHVKFRFLHNFVDTGNGERIPRILFWTALFGLAWHFGLLAELALFYLVPLFLVTQLSSWLQHTTEHLWFAEKPDDVSTFVYYGSLTWGRFLGRPYPHGARGLSGVGARARWWLSAFLIDLPVKLFSFMQDLPSHDFHHRSPKVNFWSISRERAAHEGRPSKFGPMTETWSLLESWRIVRDHVCHGESDPFGVWEWDRRRNREAA